MSGDESLPTNPQIQPESDPDPNLNPPTYTPIQSHQIPSPELETPPESPLEKETESLIQSQENPLPELKTVPESQRETLLEAQPEKESEPESQPFYSLLKTQESPPVEPEIEPVSQPKLSNAGDEVKVGDGESGEAIPVEEKKGEVSRTLTMRELLDELKTEEQSEDPASATPRR